jgi:cell wall-associated NlpC family hydrolase
MSFARQALLALACPLAAVALAGCGEAAVGSGANAAKKTKTLADSGSAAAKGTDPVVGAGGASGSGEGAATAASGASGSAREVADPLEAESYPAPASVKHAAAATPSKAGEAIVAAGAPSNAEIRRELKQMQAVERSARKSQQLDLTPVPGGESIGGNGTIPIPSGVPEVVQKVIAGANEIADFPYVYGGGHASFVDDAYDCSGSVSYALAAGGLLSAPETSGQLESWGAPGPGKYITVYANAGHTYMYVDGILYDTAGRSGVYASRWQVGAVDNAGYVARHWPGL